MGWVQGQVLRVGMSPAILVVLGVVLLALVLFVTGALPVDVTAIVVLLVLTLLEPWTTISPEEAISGFANEATITVLAMLILSAGISRTGHLSQPDHELCRAGRERRANHRPL